MIKINLLSEGKRPTAVRKTRRALSLEGKEVGTWLLAAGIVIGLVAVGVYWWLQNQRLAEVQGEVHAAEAEVERLAAEAAAQEARRRAAEHRLQEAEQRASRTQRALEQAKREGAALGEGANPQGAQARAELEDAEAALAAARSALEAAEERRGQAAESETAAREAARKLDDHLGRLTAEARALASLVAQARRGGFAPALDSVRPDRGYEQALAAAFGDDLDAALDAKAPAYWGGREAEAPSWPAGATPLAPLIKAPPALAARLAFTALVEAADGDRLQPLLAPGCRLVSKAGDLWRWDGLTARAEAPRPAAVRLEQKTRLAEVEGEIEGVSPRAAAARQALEAAQAALRQSEEALKEARRAPGSWEQKVQAARGQLARFEQEMARKEAQAASLDELIRRFEAELAEQETSLAAVRAEAGEGAGEDLTAPLAEARAQAASARETAAAARSALDQEVRERDGRARRLETLGRDRDDWTRRAAVAAGRIEALAAGRTKADAELAAARAAPDTLHARRETLLSELAAAEARRAGTSDALAAGEQARIEADRALRAAEAAAAEAREVRASLAAHAEAAAQRLAEVSLQIRETARVEPEALLRQLEEEAVAIPSEPGGVEAHLYNLERQRDSIGPVNLRAEEEAAEYAARLAAMQTERADLTGAIARLRQGIDELNSEGRERLTAAFEVINGHFKTLFSALFEGGQAELRLVESEDPLEAGLEIYACPPGKRLAAMSLMSGGEQALTAAALIFAVFLAQPAPICVLDEVDAPLDDANVDRFCNMLDEMARRTRTRFIAITHNPVTMARMDRLFGVTMAERGVSQLVSVDLRQAEAMAAQ